MNKELEELKNEFNLLKERVNVIEKRERKRKTMRLLGILFKIIFYGAMIFGIYLGYKYVMNIPSMITDKVKENNPLNSIDFGNFDLSSLFGDKEDKS